MNYRYALLLSPEDLGGGGTKVIDIDVKKPISEIDIKFTVTKSANGMEAPGPANISAIELVDGSKVLHSLNGYENQALAYYSRRNIVLSHGQEIDGSSETELFKILFGRHLWDELLAFIPGNFVNPQLKITFDEDVSDTGVTANECEVWARIFDEKAITPIGFLSAIEHYQYTCGAANSYETISLPEDREFRQLLVRAYQDGYEPWYQIDEARLDEGTLDRIPFNFDDLETYYRVMKSVWPLLQIPLVGIASAAGQTFYVPVTDYWANILVTPNANAPDVYHAAASMRGGKASLVSAAATQFQGLAAGYLPWHTYQFPMGKLNDVDDWYNPAGKKPRLRLRAGTGGTSGTGEVVIEELFRY